MKLGSENSITYYRFRFHTKPFSAMGDWLCCTVLYRFPVSSHPLTLTCSEVNQVELLFWAATKAFNRVHQKGKWFPLFTSFSFDGKRLYKSTGRHIASHPIAATLTLRGTLRFLLSSSIPHYLARLWPNFNSLLTDKSRTKHTDSFCTGGTKKPREDSRIWGFPFPYVSTVNQRSHGCQMPHAFTSLKLWLKT